MGKHIFFRIVMAFVIIAAIAGLGAFAYQAGLAQGAARTAVAAGGQAAGPAPFAAAPYFWGPFGFHHFGFFGIFGLLIPIFFFLVIFTAVRGLLFGRFYGMHGWHGWRRGPWGMRYGDWDKEDMDVPPFMEEMHRRMHEQERGREQGGSEEKKS